MWVEYSAYELSASFKEREIDFFDFECKESCCYYEQQILYVADDVADDRHPCFPEHSKLIF